MEYQHLREAITAAQQIRDNLQRLYGLLRPRASEEEITSVCQEISEAILRYDSAVRGLWDSPRNSRLGKRFRGLVGRLAEIPPNVHRIVRLAQDPSEKYPWYAVLEIVVIEEMERLITLLEKVG